MNINHMVSILIKNPDLCPADLWMWDYAAAAMHMLCWTCALGKGMFIHLPVNCAVQLNQGDYDKINNEIELQKPESLV